MNELTIALNPEHPAYLELSRSVAETLDEFESITYKQEKKTVEPGTLSPGLHEIAAFVVTHHDKIIPIVAPLLSALSNLVRWSSASSSKDKKEQPPMVVIVENRNIQFPASAEAQKRFVRRLEGRSSERTPKLKRPTKRSRGASKKKSKTRKHSQ
jgi:hypothetical protein